MTFRQDFHCISDFSSSTLVKRKTDYYWIYANNLIAMKNKGIQYEFLNSGGQWDSDIIFKMLILDYINRMVLKCRFSYNSNVVRLTDQKMTAMWKDT